MSTETESLINGEEPCNALERALVALFNGEVAKEEFLRTFLHAQVYLLLDGEPTGGTLGSRIPLVIADSDSAPRMMAVFSHPTRANSIISRFPDYSHQLMVDVLWLLNYRGKTTGLAINPGCSLGFELSAESAEFLKDAVSQAQD